MKKSMCLVVVLLSILSNPASGQWLKTDTVTSGDYDDHSPRIDHNGGAWTSSGPAAGEWMVFQRDSAHLSSIAGKRFWFQKQKWDTAVSQISPAINGVEQTSPDVCGLVKGYDSLIVLAAWLREEDGFKRIYFSTTVGDSTAWSVPQRLNDDTVKDASLKLGPNGNSVFVTWKCGNVVMYSLFYQDSISRADTLVISNFDSVEYDLEAYSIAWTFRDSASGHICLAHGSITLGLPSHISYIDTIRSSGDIRNPSLTGEQYFFPTYEVQAGDRIEVHTMGLSGPPAQFTDSTLFSAPGVNALDPAAFSLGYDNYWIWEQQTVSGTSIVFTLSGSYRTTVSDTFIGGRNPVMGSNAQQVRNYPLNTFANVAIWEYPINGESKIYGRVFLPYIGDAVKEKPDPASSFVLSQNYPNPFNPSTVISYQLPVVSHVTLKIYDILGREVATLVDEKKSPGTYEVKFDGSRFASGVYFCRMTAGNYVSTRKLLLLK